MRHDRPDGLPRDLANRIRELIASEDGYTEQKMFGGIARPFEMRGREMKKQ